MYSHCLLLTERLCETAPSQWDSYLGVVDATRSYGVKGYRQIGQEDRPPMQASARHNCVQIFERLQQGKVPLPKASRRSITSTMTLVPPMMMGSRNTQNIS